MNVVLNEGNLCEVLQKLRSIVNGNSIKISSGEVEDIDSLNTDNTYYTTLENVFFHKKYDSGIKEHFIESLNNDEEEFRIFLGDKVFIHSDTKFSVTHRIEQPKGKRTIFSRDDIYVLN
jgi:hypothetical protein